MMIKDLEVHRELTSDERQVVRGGSNTILPGGCVDPPFPRVPSFEDMEKYFEKFHRDVPLPKDLPRPPFDVVPL
jgi:hypothetical protein